MSYLVPIDDTEEYTVDEVIHLIRKVLIVLSGEIPDDIEVIYPGKEVFFLVKDLIGWINGQIPGHLTIRQTKSRRYEIVYYDKKMSDDRSRKQSNQGLASTAAMLYEQTGKLPSWGKKPGVREIILNKYDIPVEETDGE